MGTFATLGDLQAIEAESAWDARALPQSIYSFLGQTAAAHGNRPAISYQLLSDPKAPAQTLTWSALQGRVTQAANLFRSLGVEENDVVAYILPNAFETAITLLAGATAGIVNSDNPPLGPQQIASLLRETGA